MKQVLSLILLFLLFSPDINAKNEPRPIDESLSYSKCEADAGDLVANQFVSEHPIKEVRGKLQLRKLKRHKKWAPVVSIGLKSNETNASLYIQLSGFYKDNPRDQRIRRRTFPKVTFINSSEKIEEELQIEYSIFNKVEFSITISDDFTTRLWLEDFEEGLIFPYIKNPTELYISCSTAVAAIEIEEIIYADSNVQ